ncbi:MAG: cysteine dioxygenase family protein [Fimbriimonadaceae bacterium]|nr:cysteine dioxygenase family protein [Fimbriimonadaceae bacterium]
MAATTPNSKLNEMIALLDDAVAEAQCSTLCHRVKDALEQIVACGEDFIPAELLKPHPESYARRLVHNDPEGRYTILAMVWGKGQGTKLHDHAGKWCVECVYRGRIRVVSYDLVREDGDMLHFAPQQEIYAGVGEAGALIPPYEYHTIENTEQEPTVTIHVYSGELTWCNVFEPAGENTFRRVRKELCYTE